MTICGLMVALVTFFHPVYLQALNNSEICSTATFAAKTVFDFWHESTQDCSFDVENLLKLHKKVSMNTDTRKSDQISSLIEGHVRSALRRNLFEQLIALITTKNLTSKPDIEKVFDQLYNEQDKRFLLEIWQNVLADLFLFMDADDILQQILMLTNGQLKLHLLDHMLKKYENQSTKSYKFLPLLTFGLTSVIKQRLQTQAPVADPSIARLMAKLPQQLLIIFQSWNYNVSVLNSHSNEYLFAELNNDASANKRFLFSFLPAKNVFRVKGKFKMQISASGLVTLGAFYHHSYSYLTADKGSAFICLDCAVTAAQWWQVLWLDPGSRPADDQFVLLQNVFTQELLCSTNTSNQDLLLVCTADIQHHINDSLCHWKVVKRIK